MDTNFRLSQIVLEVLIQNRCHDFVFCPGSRNSPLVRTLFEISLKSRIQLQSHFDERGAAFYALGLAKSHHRPVTIITTSGTAVANLYPAVVEAYHSDIPLVALTADRPQRLHHVSANQTINQQGFFSHFIRGESMLEDYLELTSPDEEALRSDLKATLKELWRGPVHINCPFDEPLLVTQMATSLVVGEGGEDVPSFSPMRFRPKDNLQVELDRILSDFLVAIKTTVRGLVVLGELNQCYKKEDIFALVKVLMDKGWYVIAEIQSGMRRMITDYFDSYGWGSGGDNLLENYSLLLQKKSFVQTFNIDTVVHLGGRLVDKALSNFLKNGSGINYIHIDRSSHHYNPDGVVTQHHHIDPPLFCYVVEETLNRSLGTRLHHEIEVSLRPKIKNYRFRKIDRDLSKFVSGYDFHKFCELDVSRSLAKFSQDYLSGKPASIFIGNSMPIRDLNMMGARIGFSQVFANRGASGIDGLIATACGVAMGKNQENLRRRDKDRLYIIVGDLSALHDINSLILVKKIEKDAPITLIIINNHEGTIFRYLPSSKILEDYSQSSDFYCRHDMEFSAFASAVGFNYRKLSQAYHFESTLKELHSDTRSHLLEITIDPKANWEEHTRFHLDTMNHIDYLLEQS